MTSSDQEILGLIQSYFNEDFYAYFYPDVADASVTPMVHYAYWGWRELRDPNEWFSTRGYLEDHADVRAAGVNPFYHYLALGAQQGRKLRPSTLDWRRGRGSGLESAQAAAPATAAPIRAPTRPAPKPGTGAPVEEATVDWRFDIDPDDWRLRAADIRDRLRDERRALLDARFVTPAHEPRRLNPGELAFAESADPQIDIVIPFYNAGDLTRRCLEAIYLSQSAVSFRVILVDDVSTEEDALALGDTPGITLLRNAEPLHFLRGCNRAFAQSDAPFVLLLNNDARLRPGALDALLAAMDDEAVAAAAPKIVYPSGHLQEAGCAIRPDATTEMVGLNEDPGDPDYNYARDVAYASGACLLVRRAALGDALFDDQFSPAYCEDVDLCLRLRDAGHRIRYVPEAEVVHDLSASATGQDERVQQAITNQHKIYAKWRDRLEADSRLRVLAFYLPQFHPIPENDAWWGKGFTEWTNVARARPSYAGHYQPHLPADLGYYDLRLPQVMAEQYALAHRYGIEGFVCYYYHFGDRRLLETPLEQMLARPDLPFRFAPCWANENWTRHWDGGDRQILAEQRYDRATFEGVADDAVRMARDARAIRIEGRPLFLVYRPLLFPDVRIFTDLLRARFAAEGLADPYLLYVEATDADGTIEAMSPAAMGFDGAVEFPPAGLAAATEAPILPLKNGWTGRVYDYPQTVVNSCLRAGAGYRRFPAVFPSWDNTARQSLAGTSFFGDSPAAFAEYVRDKASLAHRMFVGDERLLFVNAWNEWAEGAHLEPDLAFGHAWLQALEDGVQAALYPGRAY